MQVLRAWGTEQFLFLKLQDKQPALMLAMKYWKHKVIKQSLKITKSAQDNLTIVEISVFKYKTKIELGKALDDFLSPPPIET